MYLALIGCPPRPGTRGQIEVDAAPFEDESSPLYRPSSYPTWHIEFRGTLNLWSCVPVINVFSGILHLFEGVFSNGYSFNVAPDDKWKFKILTVITGILELTLIGGWIVHGIATFYFYRTEPSEEEIRLMEKAWAKEEREECERERRRLLPTLQTVPMNPIRSISVIPSISNFQQNDSFDALPDTGPIQKID